MNTTLKFAMVTADARTSSFEESMSGDFWSMYTWGTLFEKNMHYSYSYIKDNYKELDKYDIVMFSGHPNFLSQIISLALNTKAVTIFFPEGDISFYHDRAICPEVYKAWDACSIFGMVEEDKYSYYSSLTKSSVYFLHIPVQEPLVNGYFFLPRNYKNGDILVYGDNNPNNPLTALAVARRLKKSVTSTELSPLGVDFARDYLGVKFSRVMEKCDQAQYLQEYVAQSRVLVYPTRWIGTSRQSISGAICGTPVVGSRDSHTQQRLFPQLCTKIYDVDTMCSLVERLYTDTSFYDDCTKYAFDAVKFYGSSMALQRLLAAYEEVKQKKVREQQ